jgi:uncharacterized membrane protein HdeD (DUF308 family)
MEPEVPVQIYIGVKSWWLFLVTGLIAIAFGVILLAWPASTIKVLAYLVGVLALIEGAIATCMALYLAVKRERMGVVLTRGVVGILIGVLLLAKTGLTLTVVIVLVAIWAIVYGAVEFFGALELPPMSGRGWIAVSGLLRMILGIVLLLLPLQTVYAAIVVFSVFLLAVGVIRLVFAFYALSFERAHRA